MAKTTSVNLSDENHQWIKSNYPLGFTAAVNDVFDKLRVGMLKEGKQVDAPEGSLDWYLEKYTDGDLEKISKIRKIQLMDAQIDVARQKLNPSAAQDLASNALDPAQSRVPARLPKGYWQTMCRHCGAAVFKTPRISSKRGYPIPLDDPFENMAHDCPQYSSKYAERQPVLQDETRSKHVTCDDCQQSFALAKNSLNKLLDGFVGHIEGHGRMLLSDRETRQFRELADLLKKKEVMST